MSKCVPGYLGQNYRAISGYVGDKDFGPAPPSWTWLLSPSRGCSFTGSLEQTFQVIWKQARVVRVMWKCRSSDSGLKINWTDSKPRPLLIALILNFGLFPRKDLQISSCPNGKFISKKYILHSSKNSSIALWFLLPQAELSLWTHAFFISSVISKIHMGQFKTFPDYSIIHPADIHLFGAH